MSKNRLAPDKYFESTMKIAIFKEIIKQFYRKRPVTSEEERKIMRHVDVLYDDFYQPKSDNRPSYHIM